MATTRLMTLALAAGALWAGSAGATSMVQLSTDQLVDAADAVVHGTISEVWAETDHSGNIWTRAQVDVEEVLKGDSGLTAVVVDQPGGTWAGRTMRVPGAARFSVGEEVVLFLQVTPDQVGIVGMHQGKYTVRLDPHTRSEIVQRFAPDHAQPYDHRFIPLPDESRRVYLDDIQGDISHRVEHGWDGQAIPGTSLERLEAINGKGVR